MEPILLYDTTLRDGTQGENISFTAEEKVKIAQRLDRLGIHYIEGGWPGSNPRDMQFFELAKDVQFKHAKLAAFGSTCKPNTDPAEDRNVNALMESGTPVATIVGKSWDLHVESVMHNRLSENLNMIQKTVQFFKKNNREVIFDAEHFFDGFKDNADYAMQTVQVAFRAGADRVVLCDTNGGCLPTEIASIIKEMKAGLDAADPNGFSRRLGIHTHNDSGLAVANTLVAVNAGIGMVQGTVNGYGERCGNADLTTIIPNLQLKMNRPCIPEKNLLHLKKISRFVSFPACPAMAG